MWFYVVMLLVWCLQIDDASFPLMFQRPKGFYSYSDKQRNWEWYYLGSEWVIQFSCTSLEPISVEFLFSYSFSVNAWLLIVKHEEVSTSTSWLDSQVFLTLRHFLRKFISSQQDTAACVRCFEISCSLHLVLGHRNILSRKSQWVWCFVKFSTSGLTQ